MMRILRAMYACHLLSVRNSWALARALRQHGINVMALLQFTANVNGSRIAIVDDEQHVTYKELLQRSEHVARWLHATQGVKPNMKVALHGQNSVQLVVAIFALSRIGARVYCLSSHMSARSVEQLLREHRIELVMHDDSYSGAVHGISMDELLNVTNEQYIAPTSSGQFILLTGGTTGKPKCIEHQPSIGHYVHPFLALVNRLQLPKYTCSYIATPIYHGYGLALLFVLVALGKKIVITRSFHASTACALITRHEVQFVTVVPLMLQKLLTENAASLRSLQCIASGGALLSPQLVKQVTAQLGPVVYNLYGTSETGLNCIATPTSLAQTPATVGRCIEGMAMEVREPDANGIGRLAVKSDATMLGVRGRWVETGDLGYCTADGCFVITGRADDLVISGGVNVYPVQLEQQLLQHEEIVDVSVVGVNDAQFGQRLCAYVQTREGSTMTESQLMTWLKANVSRYEMPKQIILLPAIPYTALGKKDKKALVAIGSSKC